MSKNSKTKKITEAYDEMEFLEQESKKVQLERKILEEKEKKLLDLEKNIIKKLKELLKNSNDLIMENNLEAPSSSSSSKKKPPIVKKRYIINFSFHKLKKGEKDEEEEEEEEYKIEMIAHGKYKKLPLKIIKEYVLDIFDEYSKITDLSQEDSGIFIDVESLYTENFIKNRFENDKLVYKGDVFYIRNFLIKEII